MGIRYWQAQSRTERGKLLDEMEAVTEMHRKSLVRTYPGYQRLDTVAQTSVPFEGGP